MDVFLRRSQVERVTGLSRSEIYRRIKEQTFPEPIQLGSRAVAWTQSSIEEWQRACQAEGWNPERLSLNTKRESAA